MFKSSNFCHIASNNRNNVKAGVFVYRTTDDLATVSASGYFNERIIDINLHDLIIHEKIDATDKTKVQKNVLCVTERTANNVGTKVIKSKWEEDTDQAIADLQTYVDNTFVRKDGTSVMTGPLKFRAGSFVGAIAGGLGDGISVYKLKSDNTIDSEVASLTETNGFVPGTTNTINIGSNSLKWKDLYLAGNANIGGKLFVATINNGADLIVPTTGGTIATTGNTVTIDTDQTITGAKTFTGSTKVQTGINLYNPNVTKGTTPSSTQYWALRVNDLSNSSTWQNTRLGVVEWSLSSDNTTKASLIAYANIAGGSTSAIISVGYNTTNSTAYTSAPTPTDTTTTSGQQIATTGWVNTTGNNIVHLTNAETITGSKTFTNTIKTSFSTQYPNGLEHTNTLIPNNYSSPANDVSVVTNALLSNAGDFVAYESMSKTAAGVTSASLYVRNRASSSGPNRTGGISVIIDSSGNVSTYAPKPAASSNDNNMATTSWVKTYAMGMPDWSNATQVTDTYTATKNGWFVAWQWGSNYQNLQVYINQTSTTASNIGFRRVGGANTAHGGGAGSMVPVNQGDVVTVGHGDSYVCLFVPCKNL